ncbi:hypothetical protein OUZ56_002603 [Daphnia magna]|uniref:Secreted protein n=1 Tax=Daphnia magna TaxID=35525 RepID=A0ABR0A6G6_9CRUS|nr:hypothetical protein OUZ56_002603 [Daphnia magna]
MCRSFTSLGLSMFLWLLSNRLGVRIDFCVKPLASRKRSNWTPDVGVASPSCGRICTDPAQMLNDVQSAMPLCGGVSCKLLLPPLLALLLFHSAPSPLLRSGVRGGVVVMMTVHQMELFEIVSQIHFIHDAIGCGRIAGRRILLGFCYLDGRRRDAHTNRFSLFQREVAVIVDGVCAHDALAHRHGLLDGNGRGRGDSRQQTGWFLWDFGVLAGGHQELAIGLPQLVKFSRLRPNDLIFLADDFDDPLLFLTQKTLEVEQFADDGLKLAVFENPQHSHFALFFLHFS